MKIIAFSGGLDSTKILLDLVKEGSSEEILCVSFTHSLLTQNKVVREKEARGKIIKKVEKDYSVKINTLEFNCQVFDHDRITWKGEPKGLSQPILWITNIIPFINDGDSFYLGYVLDDAATMFIHNIEEAFNNLCAIGKKESKLVFPLLDNAEKKSDVISYFLSNDLDEYLKICTFCEGEQEEDYCGDCKPCCKYKSSLFYLMDKYRHHEKMYKKCKSLLRKDYKLNINIPSDLRGKKSEICNVEITD